MSIAENLHRIQERIARAAERGARSADEIRLVGVTKYVGPREATELAAAGCHDLGESRPQELWKKADALQNVAQPVNWHLIGHLQRNKVARTLSFVSLIHCVDSERLMAELNEACTHGHGMPSGVDVLLEVNTSGETAKHGLAPDNVESLLEAMPKYPRVSVLGLMTMAALEGGPSIAARNFATLRELRDKLRQNKHQNVGLDELSMGMSDDFEVAIQEGATIVRIGSLLWENSD